MKKLILITLLLSAFNVFAGVSGDKIHFQKHSTWVSAAFSKSLCLNEETENYQAVIRKCFNWERGDDDRVCTDYRKILAVQPMLSTRQRCSGRNDDDRCDEWETVPYLQKRVKKVVYTRNSGDGDRDVYKTEIITIPACN